MRSIDNSVKKLFISFFLLTSIFAFAFQEGLASWYGGKFQGRRTASGEIYDKNKFTAAHKTLPFGMLVKVTNMENGKSATVRINDRGPFVEGRIIDLSQAAATEIGMTGKGLVQVRIEPFEDSVPANRYSIQLGAYREIGNAERLMNRLEENGFEVVLEETSSGIIRVLIGNIEESSLNSTKEKLYQAGFKNFLIRRQR